MKSDHSRRIFIKSTATAAAAALFFPQETVWAQGISPRTTQTVTAVSLETCKAMRPEQMAQTSF